MRPYGSAVDHVDFAVVHGGDSVHQAVSMLSEGAREANRILECYRAAEAASDQVVQHLDALVAERQMKLERDGG